MFYNINDGFCIDLSQNNFILDLELIYNARTIQAVSYPSSMQTLNIWLNNKNIPFCLSNLPMNLDTLCLEIYSKWYNYVELASYLTNKNLKCLNLLRYDLIEFTTIYDLLSDKC